MRLLLVYYIRMSASRAQRIRNIIVYAFWLGFAAAVYILRQPSAFTHPQLYAEDALWLGHAYNDGIFASLFRPDTGYLQSVSRIVGAVAASVPLELAPYVFVYASLAVRILFVAVILSERNILLPGIQKYIFAFASILSPNTQEVHMNFNYSQWFLALSAVCILLYSKPKTILGRWIDLGIVVLASFSGPFVLLFVPILLFEYLYQKKKFVLPYLWISAVASITQVYFLFSDSRVTILLSRYWWRDLFAILQKQIFFGAVVSRVSMEALYARFDYMADIAGYAIVCIGLSVIFYAYAKSSVERKLFVAFGIGMFVLSVCNSMARQDWDILITTYDTRYWLIPRLTFLACVIFIAYDQFASVLIRSLSGVVVAAFIATLVFDPVNFRYSPLPDMHWKEYTKAFYELDSGVQYMIPINPEEWNVVLVRR